LAETFTPEQVAAGQVEFEGWLKTGDAAKRLRVSTQRIAQLIDKKRLEVRWTPFGRLVSVKSVDEYDQTRRSFLWADLQKVEPD